jgi:predicted Zn-dependent protease
MNHLINQPIRVAAKKRFSGRFIHLIITSILLTTLCTCASVPHSGRRQFNMISDRQLNSLGAKAFSEVVDKEPESQDKRLKAIVSRVAERVGKAAESMDKPNFDWEVRLVENDTPNAFCLPGGKIVVYTGMLKYAKNEAGLAAIVAHEVAHAVARHGGERLSQKLALHGALAVGEEALKNKDGSVSGTGRLVLGALGIGGTVGVLLPYSRIHELEADQIGQMYMAKAGYDPAESVRVWDRLSRIKKPPIPVWLSTHPADAERVRKLRESLPDAEKIYQETPRKYGLGSLL